VLSALQNQVLIFRAGATEINTNMNIS